MSSLVECVPNVSEGRNVATLNAIGEAVRSVPGVALLDVDRGEATNRTVFTMVGGTSEVEEAAFRLIRTAASLIDMRTHTGAHPRMGATDVCPFIPLSGLTMEECVAMARRLGRRVADELAIPVYLYEAASQSPQRKSLAAIRQGEYEGLEARMATEEWAPDFGSQFNPVAGATVIGAREFLIAYNINLNTRDRKLAHDIALEIRESGRAVRDVEGKTVRGEDGNPVMKKGRFEECRAVGWYIDEYSKAQISINLTNYKRTPPQTVFDAVRDLARERGLRVTGSEIVGLVPLEAMLLAGRHYLALQGKTPAVPEPDVVRMAVDSLGLSELTPFKPEEKIVEYRVAQPSRLASLAVKDFSHEVSSESPAPGGGSVAALEGSLGAALVSMVAALSHAKLKDAYAKRRMEEVGSRAQTLKDRLMGLVDEDSRAFEAVLEARRRKGRTVEEKTARAEAISGATKRATAVPMEVAELCAEVASLAESVAREGEPNAISDAGVAAESALAGFRGARLNVLINLASIEDEGFRGEMMRRLAASEQAVKVAQAEAIRHVEEALAVR